VFSYAVFEAPQILELKRDKEKEATNHQVGKRVLKVESTGLVYGIGEDDMQNNERDYHQHGSKKQNVSLPFENA
jgi:hypothetical protein